MAGPSNRLGNSFYSDSESEESDFESSGEDGEEDVGESDSDENIEYNPTWSPATSGLRSIPFTKQNELLIPNPGENKPIDWFLLLCNLMFLENIVAETNRYAREVFFGPNLQPKSRINKWVDLTVEELKRFIGLLFHMGTVRLNRFNDYWKTNRMFDFKFVRQQMSRDRFLVILRCLHFCNNNSPSDDKLKKVNMLIDHFNNTMLQVYYPCKELSIDESMVLWRGRLSFRQYIKGKRHKYGMKLYNLCEPTGLVLKFLLYSGKGGELGGKGHTDKVVRCLMRGKLNVGHAIYTDNFYNSFPLASELLRKLTYCTGTLRSNRKYLPVEVTSARLRKGETIERYAEGVMVGKWCDQRSVLYLSTEFENTMAQSRNRRGILRDKPLPIVHYNAEMKGVDRSDQMLSYYPCDHKSLRWYKKIFVHVLQMMMVNAYRLFLFANPDSTCKSLYDFRLQVIDSLLPEVELPPTVLRGSPHVISKIMKRDNRDRIVGKRCRVCHREGINKRTVYMCAECPGEPGLCPLACFDKFHEG